MLKKLLLNNFQSHKHTEIEFAEHVTAIVGLNNQGKSAIFRGLQKCIRNIPDGNSFITDTPNQEHECIITVESDEGIVSRKVRNDNASDANAYIIENNGVPEVYAKFGRTGIPDEIMSKLPVDLPQTFGDVEIDLNFHNQLDDMFLMQGSGLPALRGKVLGKATGVDKVQRAVQLCAAEEKRLKGEIKNLIQQQEDVNNKLQQYVNLDDYIEQTIICSNTLEYIDSKRTTVLSYKEKLAHIKNIVDKATQLQSIVSLLVIPSSDDIDLLRTKNNTRKALATFTETSHKRDKTAHFCKNLLEVEVSWLDLMSLREQVIKYNAAVRTLQIWNSLYSIELTIKVIDETIDDTIASYKGLVAFYDNVQILKEKRLFLYTEGAKIGNLMTDIEVIDRDLANVTLELDAFKQELGVCPTCGKQW